MNSHTGLTLAAALVALIAACSTVCSADTLVSCYNCTTDPTTGADNNCATVSTSTPTAVGCTTCVASVDSSAAVPLYSRTCSTVPRDESCDSASNCYCKTDKCNNEAFNSYGSLQCYSCTSDINVDNGCGQTVDPSSVYVKKLQGCTLCSKSVTAGPIYKRDCSHEQTSTDSCSSVTTPTCTFQCTTDLCNEAAPSGVRMFPSVLLILSAIYCSLM